MTTAKNMIGSHVSSVFSRSVTHGSYRHERRPASSGTLLHSCHGP